MNKIKYIAVVLIAIAGLGLQPAKADSITFQITSDHSTVGLGIPPFGTVTLTQNGVNVDFNITLATGYDFLQSGSTDGQFFKFNGLGVTVGDIVNINQNFTNFVLIADTGTFNGDGTGNFTFGITSVPPVNGNSTPYFGPLTFTVDNATIADLTQPNNNGILFVADLFSVSTGGTGPADVTPGGKVPDSGATAMLLGLGLSGLGLVRRFVKR